MSHSTHAQFVDTLEVGRSARLRRCMTREDLSGFATFAAEVTGEAAERDLAADPDVRRALSLGGVALGLVVALILTRLPGPGTQLRGVGLTFSGRLDEGDEALAEVRVAERDPASGTVTLDVRCLKGGETLVLLGEFEVIPPHRPRAGLESGSDAPRREDGLGDRLAQIEARARQAGPIRMAVVNPVDGPSLAGALDSARAGLVEPVLIAPTASLRKAAEAEGLELSGIETIDVDTAAAAAERAAALAAEGDCKAIMKGSTQTETLLRAVLAQAALRTGRRLSHVFVEDLPGHPRLLFVTDAAVNIRPDLTTLRDTICNAVSLAQALGVKRPKVAVLSAVETVTEELPSTTAAAALCKMAERGEITGAEVDGPLALDNAISERAARIKGIESGVAGRADILVAPDLEAGNILAKALDHLGGAEAAGIALGARVPLALTSRADIPRERRAAAALAAIMATRTEHDDEDAE